MKNRVLITIVLFAFLFSSACLLANWYDSFIKDPDPWISRLKEDQEDIEEDKEHLVGVDDEVAEDPHKDAETDDIAEEEEAPPPKKYNPLDPIMAYHGFTEGQKSIIKHMYENGTDRHRDYIKMISYEAMYDGLGEVDLRGIAKVLTRYNREEYLKKFGNTLFPCDTEIPGGFVVCTDDPIPFEPGDVHLFMFTVGGDIPVANPDYYYTYSVVLDADGDPSNNFEFTPPNDWDYYQDTDRWYILDWKPDSGDWTLNVMDVVQNIYPYPSAARAVVMGDVVAFFIPATEFVVENPGYRITTFAQDVNFSPDGFFGDVSGADPTEPLWVGSPEIIVVE